MDAIFKALNDPARRALLDTLRRKDGQTLSELEAPVDMTRFGVMKHLGVLEAAGLITTRKKGRFKYHYLNALPLQEVIDRWIEPFLAKPAARAVIDLKTQLERTAPMPPETLEKPDVVMETYIRCSHDALWSALTDPDQVAHYHFLATSAKGDLAEDGKTIYYREDGSEMLHIIATRIEPKSLIEMTFHPKWAGPDMPASRVAYHVTSDGGHCKLTIEHFGVPEGQEGIGDGWARLTSGLKSYLESGKAARFGFG